MLSKVCIFIQIWSVESEPANSYQQDEEWEGRPCNSYFDIGLLDEDAIASWWSQFRNKSNYHLLGNNCCSVVYTALEKGGAGRFASSSGIISTPANLKSYAQKLEQATRYNKSRDEL